MSTSDKQNKPLDLIFFLPHVPWVNNINSRNTFLLKTKNSKQFLHLYSYTLKQF